MFTAMTVRDRLPQIELAVGEDVTVFVLRNLVPIPEDDAARLRDFADRHGIHWWLQPKGPDGAHPFYPLQAPALDYALPEFGLRLAYRPTEFTQVNAGVNRVLVRRAVDMLDPKPGERVGDLFCGLGNFTLALASRGADVVGMEGAATLVERATTNARANGLATARASSRTTSTPTPRARFARLGLGRQAPHRSPRDGAMESARRSTSRTCPRGSSTSPAAPRRSHATQACS